GLVPEQVGEVVADAPLAVVQVGVADPARLDGDERLTGPRVRHDDGDDLDGSVLGPGDDGAYVTRHPSYLPEISPHRRDWRTWKRFLDCSARRPSATLTASGCVPTTAR